METKQCKTIQKSGANDSNKHLRTVIPGPNQTLTIQVHVCEETKKALVDYEVTTSHLVHYGLYFDSQFGALDPTVVLKMLIDGFKGCKFVNQEDGNYAILSFGDDIQSIVIPELEQNKEDHLKALVLKQDEEIGKLKAEVALLKQKDENISAVMGELQKEVLQLRQLFGQHQTQIQGLNQYDSVLIPFGSEDQKMIAQFFGTDKMKLTLLYRFSRDGKHGENFHAHCDNRGPTLTIVQSTAQPKCFGGYSSASWESPANWKWVSAPGTFLFSLFSKQKYPLQHGQYEGYAVEHVSGQGPIFGAGRDLLIRGDGSKSYSCPNFSYSRPGMPEQNTAECRKELTGSTADDGYFEVKEYEVFGIKFTN